ncbi:hypothetical protein HJB79_26285 [Rhizobium lentis]|uniref:hypothetical protein n=1 Tax=Rhizobium lentis TaxID=1138194 RepID=UPI001C8303A5|nr:hypothetical protein [Rhizobium lentis]MBX5142234.1 hypothetical protein [Rhizobium lentis]MBX5153065.1 hypothetical protein [Rhizobium lentis]
MLESRPLSTSDRANASCWSVSEIDDLTLIGFISIEPSLLLSCTFVDLPKAFIYRHGRPAIGSVCYQRRTFPEKRVHLLYDHWQMVIVAKRAPHRPADQLFTTNMSVCYT